MMGKLSQQIANVGNFLETFLHSGGCRMAETCTPSGDMHGKLKSFLLRIY